MGVSRFAALCSLLALAACADQAGGPTAPTSTAPASFANTLRWDFIAPGCAPALPLPAVTGEPEARIDTKPATVVTARWLVFRSADDSLRRYIEGTFVRLDKVYAICSWDILERRVIS
jgi:hypothetical protein